MASFKRKASLSSIQDPPNKKAKSESVHPYDSPISKAETILFKNIEESGLDANAPKHVASYLRERKDTCFCEKARGHLRADTPTATFHAFL